MNKKAGTGSGGKSSGLLLGKSSGGGVQGKSSFGTGSKASKPLIPAGGKSSSGLPDTRKSYLPSSGLNPKSGKSSSTFGIIWIPTRRNKKKDLVYNPHKDDHSKDRGPTMYNFMSGDSDKQPYLKKEDGPEPVSAPTDRLRAPAAPAAGVGLVAAAEGLDTAAPQETSGLINRGETKEAAGDANENISNEDDDDYLENDRDSQKDSQKSPMSNSESKPTGDKVDSVYLRAPPPHKRAAPPPAHDDESCGFKCLYYTLQCCDCVLM